MAIEFNYAKASSLENALKLLEGRDDAYFLAGGTNLLLKIKHGQLKPGLVVGIGRLEELQFITQRGGYVRIGAGVKINELLKSKLLKESAALLLRAAGEIGSPEVRKKSDLPKSEIWRRSAVIYAVPVPIAGPVDFPGAEVCPGGGSAPANMRLLRI
jgi:CO/xanthine dehydrogenase FAD-binding subunit